MASQLTPLAADVRGEAFPTLTAEQINRIRPLSKVRKVKAGEIVFEPGASDVPFFLVLSGSMDIVQPDRQGERFIVKHEAGSFTGEITMISGRLSLVRGRVTAPGEFLEMSNHDLRTLVARDAELSGIFMRAFILRRVELINLGAGNVILLGVAALGADVAFARVSHPQRTSAHLRGPRHRHHLPGFAGPLPRHD